MHLRYLFSGVVLSALILIACKPEVTQDRPDTAVDSLATEEHVSKGFDELSSEYYQSQSRVIWQKPDLVLSLLGNLSGKTVADIGAGTGFFAFRIANAGAKVIAIDIDPRAIAWMESEKKSYPAGVQALLETRLATPANPNLKQGEAHVVLMVNTYIYLENRVEYFRNLRKGLTPDGRIIIIDFKDIETPIGPGVEERIPLSQVEAELTQAGYTILTTDSESLEYQYIITVAL
jgi:2-polyprenyl-3-methyl-5-hydroxy-6-metoxy-1,4-benzoquinol methylase